MLIRLTPKKAPFRRGGVHFPTLAAVVLLAEEISRRNAKLLLEEPLVDVDESADDGETWRRYSLPPAASARPVTDAAHSPERAIDPSGPIVPRMAVPTGDGFAAPPEAADPAVPLVRPDGEAVSRDLDGDRPVATDLAGEGAAMHANDAPIDADDGELEEAPDLGERELSGEPPRRRRAAPKA